jgi:hypothetical protein
LLQPVLLDSVDAEIIEFRDMYEDLMALMVRVRDDIWSLVTREDEDWNGTLVRYGYSQTQSSIKDVLDDRTVRPN